MHDSTNRCIYLQTMTDSINFESMIEKYDKMQNLRFKFFIAEREQMDLNNQRY